MDIYEPIRALLLLMSSEPEQSETLDSQCGIISSCYPPSELYPQGLKVEYMYPIKPKDADRYIK